MTIVNVYIPPASSCPRNYAPDFDALLEDRDFNAHHSSWFSRTGDDRAAARGEALDGAVNSSQLAVANQDPPIRLPSQGQPSSPDVTLLSGHLLPDVTWSTLTTLGSDHLPIIISLSSHAPPSPRKARSFTNFCKDDWEGHTAESERKFDDTPLPTSCSAGEKVFRQILGDAGRHKIPCGYVRDYSCPLPEVVRPLILERDQRRTDDPLDPAIKLLDRDIQRLIRQDAQDQWRFLLKSSDRATNPKRYWSLLRNLGGKRSNPPPNISIAFDGKTHSSPKATHEPSTGSSLPALPNNIGPSEGSWAGLGDPQCHESPSWGFTTETLVATYKAIVRRILNFAAPIWFPSVLLPSGQAWGGPEQSPEGRDRMLSKSRSVPPQGGGLGSSQWGRT